MSRYAWIIDVDHFPAGDKFPTNQNAKGMIGPSDATDAQVEELRDVMSDGTRRGARFRMYTDDNDLYYEGRIIGRFHDYDGFEPLDDFGAPNAGCTYIQYLQGGKWYTL